MENQKLIPIKYFKLKKYAKREKDFLLTIQDLDKELLEKRIKELDFIIKVNQEKIDYYILTPQEDIEEFEDTKDLVMMPI